MNKRNKKMVVTTKCHLLKEYMNWVPDDECSVFQYSVLYFSNHRIFCISGNTEYSEISVNTEYSVFQWI